MLHVSCSIPRRFFTVEAEFEVKAGEVFALFGPSAAGKTSVLSAVAGFETAATGRIVVDGVTWLDTMARPSVYVPVWKRKLGYVEQAARLFPHLTVRQNIFYGLRGASGTFAGNLIEQFGLASVLNVRPDGLSGGQQQRVALARALAPRPRLLLLDEPLAALDWATRRALQDLLREVNRTLGVTIVIVTHQLSEAERLANRMAVMEDGRILQQGPIADMVLRPTSWDVARRVGYTARLRLESGRVVGIHPERVVIGAYRDRGPVLSGVVTADGFSEGRRVITVDVTDDGSAGARTPLVISAHPLDAVTVGARVDLTLLEPPEFH
ncbi:ATP-binding cassette domain-containing protein [Alicyclobacillus sp. ALC3]|uniref:ATP-binding cassette domain-containing protein n=1 Tax=Alicyclobacillus sp. ALC3 TaxID=2796143 RepID=UPI002377E2ED|nr:ATP-binding cassette domain-containing protein [Alicyclobacillus sp. ALC3]WDL95759.1 ATP-binding cassette domain-containing protein [Alicyclobacillus sp. ALC3]